MKKNKSKNNIIIILLILFVSIGFAYLSTQLNIIGNAFVKSNSWNIYFANIKVNDDSVEAEEPIIDTNKTTINYIVSLNEPGDYYEFSVEVINAGTIDAMVDTVNTTVLNSNMAKYLDYKVTYLDNTNIKKKDLLPSNQKEEYKVRVEYKKDIQESDLPQENLQNLELSFAVTYVPSDLKGTTMRNILATNSSLDTGINFQQISSDQNGKGIYIFNSTKDDTYPVYYYRGAVTNNNVKFAGYCWKIVRTTETGGTKLIYNGEPDNDGYCTNTTGEATQAGTSQFNSSYTSPTYNGYMYGEIYNRSSEELSNEYLYGSDFNFVDVDENVSGDGTYTLETTTNDITSSNLNNYHYTCFNTTGQCNQIKYIYYIDNTTAYYINLNDGKSVSNALSEMMENKTSSTIKTYIDNWFETNFEPYFTNKSKDYNEFLEDTVWCNDQSFRNDTSGLSFDKSGWNPNGGNNRTYLNYDAVGRRDTTGVPRVDCKYKKDSFTVEDKELGNGLLTYPVGLLTADEIMLAGGWGANNTSYYLYTNQYWWSLSPSIFNNYNAHMFYVNYSDGALNVGGLVADSYGVRPSISVNGRLLVKEGTNGTSESPYEFVMN